MQDRTHPATPRQKERFRKRGEVARSRELTAFAVLAAGVSILVFGFHSSTIAVVGLSRVVFSGLGTPLDASLGAMLGRTFLSSTGPLLAGCFLAAIGMGAIQNGGLLRFSELKIDFEKLNPLPRLKQMFGSAEAFANLGLSLLKVSVVLGVCVATIHSRLPSLFTNDVRSLTDALLLGGDLLGTMVIRTGAALLALGLCDFGYSWVKLQRKMRMSTQQLRDDTKEEEGDPQIRQMRRRKQLDLARQRSLKAVPTADVVLVNPTHYAVALKYLPEKMNAPRVVAKGADLLAERIRKLARASGVPVLSQPPLTRTLYTRVRLGRDVPADLYQAVAVVLAYVFRLRKRTA